MTRTERIVFMLTPEEVELLGKAVDKIRLDPTMGSMRKLTRSDVIRIGTMRYVRKLLNVVPKVTPQTATELPDGGLPEPDHNCDNCKLDENCDRAPWIGWCGNWTAGNPGE
jgi:hypothetical protein